MLRRFWKLYSCMKEFNIGQPETLVYELKILRWIYVIYLFKCVTQMATE